MTDQSGDRDFVVHGSAPSLGASQKALRRRGNLCCTPFRSVLFYSFTRVLCPFFSFSVWKVSGAAKSKPPPASTVDESRSIRHPQTIYVSGLCSVEAP